MDVATMRFCSTKKWMETTFMLRICLFNSGCCGFANQQRIIVFTLVSHSQQLLSYSQALTFAVIFFIGGKWAANCLNDITTLIWT